MAQSKPTPAQGFKLTPLKCEFCGANLLDNDVHSNYVFVKRPGETQIAKMYFVCKEHDLEMKHAYDKQGYIDAGWEDIDDMLNPIIWLHKACAFMNGIQRERDMSDEAFETYKQLLKITFPYVCRQLTEDEKRRYNDLCQFGLL